MKNKMALLALSMSASLLADGCCDPCKPCCVPQPRAPICCECYTPAFYDLQCDWGLFVSVDFLYWYGRESDLSYAATVQTISRTASTSPTTATAPVKYNHLNTEWKPGVRVGLGWRMDDGWDMYANWTYYKNNKKGSTSVTPFTTQFPALGASGLLLPWADNALYNNTVTLFNSASAKWNLVFNQIDLELGRRYYLSECFTMRPYTGLRGAWIHTRFTVNGTATQAVSASVASTLTTQDQFRNRNWGVGFLAGFQPVFYFTDEFSLYANAEMALLWGQLKGRTARTYTSTQGTANTTDINAAVTSNNNAYAMQPVLDLGIGLSWETSWCENRYRFELDAGWEHHVWFDQNYRVKVANTQNVTSPTTGSAGRMNVSYFEEATNLGLGGFVLRARFDF